MRVDFPVCECGFDYRESVVVPASEDLVSLANMLLHKIYSNQSPHKEINQHVHELSLFELISFIMRISVLIASKLERVHKLQFQNNHQLPAILQNVMNTLYEWPVNFHWLLHQLVKVPAKGKTIASLMSQLYEMFNEQKYEFVIKK